MKTMKSIIALLLSLLMVTSCFVTAFAAENEEKEPNGTAATATVFELGKKIEGVLGSAEDIDCYEFKAAKTGLATIKFEHAAVSGAADAVTYFTIKVYNEKTQAEIASFTSAGVSTSDTAAFIVSANEEYIVAVEKGMVFDGTVTYGITVTVDDKVAAETEPNNTIDKTNKLELSTSGNAKYYYGAISGAEDKDYYKITVASNGVLNLYLYNEFAPKGNFTATLLAFEEDGAGVQTARKVTSIAVTEKEDSKIGPSVCVAKGDYVLEITGDAGSYKTRVFFRAVSNTETENNDSLIQADEIAVGTAYKATLDEKNDKDFFKFTAPANNVGYDIVFTATNSAKWNVRLLNSDGVAVAETLEVNATASNKTATLETLPVAAATYYVEVTAGETFDSDIYEIKVVAKEKSIAPEPEKNLFDKIGELNWGALWDNFAGWFEQINIIGLIGDIIASISLLF